MVAIRSARPGDLSPLWDLVRRAVAHMNALGNPQWGSDYPTLALYTADQAAGELYVAVNGAGRVLGCACINGAESPEYAAVAWSASPAYSVHRLAVDPEVPRQGVATALMAYAEELARRAGVPALHVDTYARNDRMQALFRKRGFRQVGAISLHGRPEPYPCFEKLIFPDKV